MSKWFQIIRIASICSVGFRQFNWFQIVHLVHTLSLKILRMIPPSLLLIIMRFAKRWPYGFPPAVKMGGEVLGFNEPKRGRSKEGVQIYSLGDDDWAKMELRLTEWQADQWVTNFYEFSKIDPLNRAINRLWEWDERERQSKEATHHAGDAPNGRAGGRATDRLPAVCHGRGRPRISAFSRQKAPTRVKLIWGRGGMES